MLKETKTYTCNTCGKQTRRVWEDGHEFFDTPGLPELFAWCEVHGFRAGEASVHFCSPACLGAFAERQMIAVRHE